MKLLKLPDDVIYRICVNFLSFKDKIYVQIAGKEIAKYAKITYLHDYDRLNFQSKLPYYKSYFGSDYFYTLNIIKMKISLSKDYGVEPIKLYLLNDDDETLIKSCYYFWNKKECVIQENVKQQIKEKTNLTNLRMKYCLLFSFLKHLIAYCFPKFCSNFCKNFLTYLATIHLHRYILDMLGIDIDIQIFYHLFTIKYLGLNIQNSEVIFAVYLIISSYICFHYNLHYMLLLYF